MPRASDIVPSVARKGGQLAVGHENAVEEAEESAGDDRRDDGEEKGKIRITEKCRIGGNLGK
jgi:hypothetical protein